MLNCYFEDFEETEVQLNAIVSKEENNEKKIKNVWIDFDKTSMYHY